MKKNKITVLYITHSSEIQGSGQALLNIIENLNRMGVVVYIVLPKAKGTLYNIIIERNIKHYILPVVSWIWPRLRTYYDYILFPLRLFRLLLKHIMSLIQLNKLAKTLNPEIIHTNVGVVHIGHYVAKRHKIPHVWHIREFQDLDFGWKTFPTRNIFLRILKNPNNFPIAITKEVYNYHNLADNINAKVIYDGVFNNNSIPEIINKKEKYLLFVGNISEGKGAKEVILAFISIAETFPEYQLWLAGNSSPKLEGELNRIIKVTKCKEQIKFLGFRNDVYSLMSKATALIVASRYEGFGFITAEAMYNGCLVVGKNTAGTKEQFDNGYKMHGSEIALRYNTENELAKVMETICNNDINDYLPIIKKAQETAIALYTKELNAENIYQLYLEIITKNGEKEKS
jgi:glycosyltransferase involved in cell wall biosynthesis